MEGNSLNPQTAGVEASTDPSASGDDRMLRINVSIPERWASAALGGALIAYGVRNRSWMGWVLALAGGNLVLRGVSGRSILYRLIGIDTSRGIGKLAGKAGIHDRFTVEKTITVGVPAGEVYRFWRNFENLPRIMRHLKTVRILDDKKSHWIAKAPAGLDIEWDAEITDEREERRIAWSSSENAEVENKGVVMFEPVQDGNATEIRVYLEYAPPGGKAGKAFAKLFGRDPSRTVEEDLRAFKSMIESGAEVIDRAARG